MVPWTQNPRIYEINTQVWLNTLSKHYKTRLQLHNVPEEVLDELASYHLDAVWLMGVWHRGVATRASALNYIHEYRGALPDIRPDDVIGSAYAIHDYQVDPSLGGRKALALFRKQLQRRGIKLILDFVPNHVAVDHPEIAKHPEYFILGTPQLLEHDKTNFFASRDAKGKPLVVAHGRDPYFPGWVDTAQFNAFNAGFRAWTLNTLKDIAEQCDGVRCDMAMLMMNHVFQRTWGWLGLQPPAEDFWSSIIPQVKTAYPDFLFIAEAYWNLEYALQVQGFDFTYDKVMYDQLVKGDVNGLYVHMGAELSFLQRNIRFIENHDEPRAASAIGVDRSRSAATLICTMPGAVLLHDGQFTGRRVKLPVQIGRQPTEDEHIPLRQFYHKLLEETQHDIYRSGEWTLFRCYTCDGCDGSYNIVVHGWRKNGDLRLVVMNMADQWSQGLIDLSGWAGQLQGKDWLLYDVLQKNYSQQSGDELAQHGLYIDLGAYHSQIYHILPVQQEMPRKITSNGKVRV
jgi:hypothetical protein